MTYGEQVYLKLLPQMVQIINDSIQDKIEKKVKTHITRETIKENAVDYSLMFYPFCIKDVLYLQNDLDNEIYNICKNELPNKNYTSHKDFLQDFKDFIENQIEEANYGFMEDTTLEVTNIYDNCTQDEFFTIVNAFLYDNYRINGKSYIKDDFIKECIRIGLVK